MAVQDVFVTPNLAQSLGPKTVMAPDVFCRQCQGDLINDPDRGLCCGTCGLPINAVLDADQRSNETAPRDVTPKETKRPKTKTR